MPVAAKNSVVIVFVGAHPSVTTQGSTAIYTVRAALLPVGASCEADHVRGRPGERAQNGEQKRQRGGQTLLRLQLLRLDGRRRSGGEEAAIDGRRRKRRRRRRRYRRERSYVHRDRAKNPSRHFWGGPRDGGQNIN